MVHDIQEEFEDTKGVIKIRISKNRQHMWFLYHVLQNFIHVLRFRINIIETNFDARTNSGQ